VIVVSEGRGSTVFTQEAHARLAGELAARLPPGHWEASALVAAARVHDNGWREADAFPTIDETGRPHTFYRVPPDVYVAVWRRGIARAAAVDALVGLLVGLHGARFFGLNPHDEVQALHEQERARQDQVLAELGLGTSWQALPDPLRSASDWIALLDQLSLTVCGALDDVVARDVAGTTYTTVRSAETITVDPWPFADDGGPVSIEGRRLDGGSFATREALRDGLADAPTVPTSRLLIPSSEP
jgi:Protein of unknown function (DUF3891)